MAPSHGATAKVSIANVHGGGPPADVAGALDGAGLPVAGVLRTVGDGVLVPQPAVSAARPAVASALVRDRRCRRRASM